MSTIRRQSIISSLVIYIGFAVGLLNTYLFAKEGIFLDSQFGLYNAFIAIATVMMAFANLAMPSFIYKFYPYYKDHAGGKKSDMLALAITISIIGFILVTIAGVTFKELIVKKYGTNAPEIVTLYNWIFPLGLGLTVFTILESYAWQLHKSVFTNFLKEVQWRLFTTVLIILFATGVINSFDLFIKLFAFSYPFIALILLLYLLFTGKINFTVKRSKVTRRFSKTIIRLCAFVYSGTLIFTISQVFDSLLISSVLDDALAKLAVYSVAQSVVALIQVPQRGIVSAAIAHLSRAWKEKNMALIQKVYQRSSINQLIFACGLFSLIILNFTDAVTTFQLKGTYLQAYYVVILLGLTKIIDMGTGVNAQIIGTSNYWRFEMVSGVILLLIMLPSNYFLTKQFDIIGTAMANLISIAVYNSIRIIFLWRKFKLFPFTIHSLHTILLTCASYAICHFVFLHLHGFWSMAIRSIAFMLLYGFGTIFLKLTPDIIPVVNTVKKRLGMKNLYN